MGHISNNFAIKTYNLTKLFGKTKAVNNLNLKIPYGETFGLVGPNGAGKTTIIRLLNCITIPDSGTAFIMDYGIIKDKHKIKMNTGLLPQSPALYNKLTAEEYLTFVGELYNLPKDIIFSRIQELLEIFDLRNKEKELLENYSRGMKQKISFSAALIHDPKILFLDEPTSNLDPSATSLVKDMIIHLKKKSKKTIFLSTNILNVAEELCDIIGIVDNGILKVIGNSDEIKESLSARSLEDVYSQIINKSSQKRNISW
ncbi:MAG: ABC transporter ATP-binding protein [Candidatus Hermodarchaeota archaeon]